MIENISDPNNINLRLSRLENKINSLNFVSASSSHQEKANAYSRMIVEEIKEILLEELRLKLAKTIMKWIQSDISFETIKYDVSLKLLEKFRKLEYADLADNFK